MKKRSGLSAKWFRHALWPALCLSAALSNGEVLRVTKSEAQHWLDHIIPLPHEVAIEKKIAMSPGGIGIVLQDGAEGAAMNAARELQAFFKSKSGVAPQGKDFEIVMGVPDAGGKINGISVPGAGKLGDLPNSSQAYIIQPIGDNKLLLAALNGKGVYYAAVTLRQLLEPVTTKDRTEIPLLSILDWPDIEERGLWNSGALAVADLAPANKLNFGRAGCSLRVGKRGEPCHASLPTNEIEQAVLRGVRFMPDIVHLNFLDSYGLYKVYPELMGKGDTAVAGQYHAHRVKDQKAIEHRAPCASNPLLTRILAEWLTDIAATGIPECGCWLSERPAQCGCQQCLAEGQFVQEARAFINAWRAVRKVYPHFGIRLFISTTTDEKYDKVMAELPPEVKVERACALGLERVRHEPRDRFVNPLLDPYAARGVWIATYDVPITAIGKVETPELIVPMSSAHRIRDFVAQMAGRKYCGMYGMLPGEANDRMNIDALAEWTWNLNGRNEHQFAAAWATRAGVGDPEKAADWSDIMGPIEFDVYDSGYPECYAWGLAAEMIRNRKKPVLGEGMFRYYTDKAAFDNKLAACGRALSIAEGFASLLLANETRVIMSYIRMAKNIYLIAVSMSSSDLSKPETREQLRKQVEDLKEAGAENAAAIREWRAAVSPPPWHPRVAKAVEYTETTVAAVAAAVSDAAGKTP